MGKMCEICKKEIATIKLSQTLDGNKLEAWICDSCQKICVQRVQELVQVLPQSLRNIFAPPIRQDMPSDMPDFIKKAMRPPNNLLENADVAIPSMVLPSARLVVTCRFCGIMLEDFLHQKYPGCNHCFREFKDDIENYLSSFNIDEPVEQPVLTIEQQIENLEVEKSIAVGEKRFTDAAAIRDKIIALQSPPVEKKRIRRSNSIKSSGDEDGKSSS